MGQAAVDLPDPLEPVAAAPSTSADDLLSQLAGEEIDRLLAEADTEAPASSDPDGARADERQRVKQAVEQAKAPVDASINAPVSPASPAIKSPAPIAPAPATPASPAPVESPLAVSPQSSIPETPTPTERPGPITTAFATSPAKIDAPAAQNTTAPNSSVDSAAIVSAELDEDALNAAKLPADSTIADLAGHVERIASDDGSLPLYVRLLEWISLPLDKLPEAVRDTVGRIAILTLFNAAAVLAYVLIFRRH